VSSSRERVHEVFADSGRDFDAKVREALDYGTDYLGLSVGFLTQIADGTQEIVQAVGESSTVVAGATCPLEDAYCRRTVQSDSPLAVEDAECSPDVDVAAYDRFGLGAYVGTTVLVDGEVYGTVCFADHEPREAGFGEEERVFVELLSTLVGNELERRRFERELQQQNARLEREKTRFQGIAETSFDIIFRIDEQATFTYVSTAVERVLGYEPATLKGEPFADFLTPAAAERAAVAYADVFDGEPVTSLGLTFLDADGEEVVVEVNATPLTDDGEVRGVQGVGRDVTARRDRERELRMKTQAIDEADDGVTLSERRPDGHPLVYVNDGFERLAGYEAATVLGEDLSVLHGPATDDDAVAALAESLDAGQPAVLELVAYRVDGTPFWNRLRLSPVHDEAGETTHVLAFHADVTERKRIEQLVALLNRMLRHNLRNDMNVLLGYGDMLADADRETTELVADQVRSTAQELVDLSHRARELETVARTETAHRRLDVETVLAEAVEAGTDPSDAAGVDVGVDTDRALCAGDEVSRAFAELVENAVKHGADPVEVTARDDGDDVVVTVVDHGPGVDEMEAAVISTGEESALQHGAGLGLWLVNWIVTRYGGSFQVRADDPGTVATVALPAVGADESVEAAARRPTVLFR
jgi:PAS domain S-box-containing protein